MNGILSGFGTMESTRFLSYKNLNWSKQGVRDYSSKSIIYPVTSSLSPMKMCFPFPAFALCFTRNSEHPLPIPILCTRVVLIYLSINFMICSGELTPPSVSKKIYLGRFFIFSVLKIIERGVNISVPPRLAEKDRILSRAICKVF